MISTHCDSSPSHLISTVTPPLPLCTWKGSVPRTMYNPDLRSPMAPGQLLVGPGAPLTSSQPGGFTGGQSQGLSPSHHVLLPESYCYHATC
ncbi:unnamed protein product [Boreogadus saida]